MAGGGGSNDLVDGAGDDAATAIGSFKRQQSMRNREFGLYASRVREDPTKQHHASDYLPAVPPVPEPEELLDYHQYQYPDQQYPHAHAHEQDPHGYNHPPAAVETAADAHGDAYGGYGYGYEYGYDYNDGGYGHGHQQQSSSSTSSSDYQHYQQPHHHQVQAHSARNYDYDAADYDFDDEFVASPEAAGFYHSSGHSASNNTTGNYNLVNNSTSSNMGYGPAPQLPPLPISPISPRWDSLVHSATVIYDKKSSPSASPSYHRHHHPPHYYYDQADDDVANNNYSNGLTRTSFDETEEEQSHSITTTTSTAFDRSPVTASFPKLHSHATKHTPHPFIPEDHPLTLTLDLEAARPDRRHELPSPITTPTSVSSRMFRPDSRQAGEPDSFNFSRPRKPSVKSSSNYHPASAPPSRPPTANTVNSSFSHSHEPAQIAELPKSPQTSSHPPTSFSAAAAANISNSHIHNHNPNHGWLRSRGHSVSSARSSSTIASVGLPHMHSYEHLRSRRNPSSSTTTTTNTTLCTSPTPAPAPSLSQPSIKLTRHHPHDQQPPWMNEEELRSSYRSQLTSSTAQGSLFTSSAHERSSVLTKSSSVTSASLNAYYFGPNGTGSHDDNLSADDVLGMYEKGFADDSAMEDNDRHSVNDDDTQEIDMGEDTTNLDASRPAARTSDAEVRDRLLEAMSDPLPAPSNSLAIPGADAQIVRDSGAFFRNSGLPSSLPKDIGLSLAEEAAKAEKRREQATTTTRTRWQQSIDDEEIAAKHDSAKMLDQQSDDSMLILEPEMPRRNSGRINTPSPSPSQLQKEAQDSAIKDDRSSAPLSANLVQGAHEVDDPDSRDRYGFKKQNQYITREQYDEWNTGYSEYLARRRKKWVAYLKDSGLMTDDPGRFPPPSAKTKRFIRKGIPPEWRGAAWFYYAGGPAILAKHSGVYKELLRRAERGEVKTIAKDDIERDLYRTFPDNVRFRRPPPPGVNGKGTPETPLHSRNPSTQSANPTPRLPGTEPEIIASLRRVLSAFAIYNPRIGYCQSLNFLAGLLLLFVETEEQAFWLLNIITRVYLPGTHEMSLEGSKVDLGVLMSELRTCLPSVWAKISEDAPGGNKKTRRRDKGAQIGDDSLPPVTLALTAWFMSCFIGTLPIESTLRVWDVFFYEGSRTLFRISLAIFKLGESEIRAMSDPMEMFGVVQSIPRKILDANLLMETCFKRRSGFGHLTADVVEEKRLERRVLARSERERLVAQGSGAGAGAGNAGEKVQIAGIAGDLAAAGESGFGDSVRRKGTLFGRKKVVERPRLAEI